MTDRARFGDFLRLAARQLDATDGVARTVTTDADVHDASRTLLELVTVMSRGIAATDTPARDLTWWHARQPSTWARSRAEARDALDNAADFLRPHARSWWLIPGYAASPGPSSRRIRWLVRLRSSGVPVQ